MKPLISSNGAGRLLDLMPGQPLIEQVAERDVRSGCRVVPHFLAQLVPDQHRCVSVSAEPLSISC